MNILVTGGSGFLGSHLVDELIKKNHKVTILDKHLPTIKLSKKSRFIKSDLLSKNLNQAVKNQDIIFHYAGISGIAESMLNPKLTADYNIIGTIRLLELCLKFNVKRFIFASTVYVNSEDGSFYKSSKRAAEDFIQEYNKKYDLEFTILRFGTIYGLRANKENSINNIINTALRKKRVIYAGRKKNIREYINVKDAAKIALKAMSKKYRNRYIKVSGRNKVPVSKALKIIKKEFGFSSRILYKNKKDVGHYTVSPNNFKIKKDIKINFRQTIPFNIGIREIIKSKL